MFKLNLKIALRNLWKNKGYTLINILGLSIGMAGSILIFIFIRYQMSYDRDYKNVDRIYRVVSNWKYADGNEFYTEGVPLPLTPAMRNDFSPYFEEVAAIQRTGSIIKVKDDQGKEKLKIENDAYYVEPNLFKIFDFKWLAGNASTLADPNTVVLSKKKATTFFGDWRKAVGKSINFRNELDLKVTGVIDDIPENSSFPFEVMISYRTFKSDNMERWGSSSSASSCFVLLKEGIKIESLEGPLKKFIDKYYTEKGPGKEGHVFESLKDIHHSTSYDNYAGSSMPMKQIYGLVVIGIFLLLTACINFINLATAQAVSRSKEVGVRKVMGSRRKQLITQFLTETLLIVIFALLIACVLTEVALPSMQNLFNAKISFSIFQYPVILVFMVGMVVLVSLLAGFYPAAVMSGFSPALAIKNKVAVNKGGLGLRKILVVVQFAITIILIIGTTVILQQMKYLREQPLGFNPTAVATVNLPNDSVTIQKFDQLRAQLLALPGVKDISYCNASPSSYNSNTNSFAFNSSKDADFQVYTKWGDTEYIKTFGLQLAAGRNLAKSDTIKEYLVNETMVKKLNIKNPNDILGKTISMGGIKAPIVGVLKDFNNKSLRNAIDPILISTKKNRYSEIAIKMDTKSITSSMSAIEKKWNTFFPDNVYHANFVDEQIKGYYESERIMGVLFRVFASVVIFISFIGLFGLISFVATQRTKEVAIRKVIGASTFELVKMLNGSFLMMVFLANLVAWPVAYIFITKWLASFEYRIDLGIWPFAFAMFISMVITLITVSIRSYKAATANTIDALKYE